MSGGESMMGPEGIWTITLGGFAAFIANVLYMIGGTKMSFGGQKWLRRFVASFILALSANLIALANHNWTWQYLCIFPCLAVGFSLGYGADTTLEKIIKRTVFALGVLTACVFGLWATGFSLSGWIVLAVAVLTGLTSIVLGVLNPFSNAPLEQFFICQILTLYIPFWSLVR